MTNEEREELEAYRLAFSLMADPKTTYFYCFDNRARLHQWYNGSGHVMHNATAFHDGTPLGMARAVIKAADEITSHNAYRAACCKGMCPQ